jgi:circadian clock protein KaiC
VEVGVALTDFEGVVSGVSRYAGEIALLGDGDGDGNDRTA